MRAQNDLLKFLAANLGLAASPLFQAMQATHRIRREFVDDKTHIGLGWIILEDHGAEIVFHGGETGGYHGFIGFDKEKKTGVVVLSNSSHDIDDIGLHLLKSQIDLAELELSKPAVKIDPAIFDSYVGRYQLAPDIFLDISREGEQF